MYNMSNDEIIKKITEKSGKSTEDIKKEISEQKKELGGLVSDEGAARIIANKLGVELYDAVPDKLKIKNVLGGMRNVEILGKVIYKKDPIKFVKKDNSEGKVGSILIGDETGSIRIVFWNESTDEMSKINKDDIIRIKNGMARDNNGNVEIHFTRMSTLEINPKGEKVDVISSAMRSAEFIEKKIIDLKENENNVEIFGHIVNVFDIRFFEVCPKCKKRVRPNEEGKFVCEKDGNVVPDYSYVTNIIVDDGSDNIRVVLFRNVIEKLLNLTSDKVLNFKENPDGFEQFKIDLLGKPVKVKGRTSKNTMYDRVEFVASDIDPNPNPEEEIKKMESEKK